MNDGVRFEFHSFFLLSFKMYSKEVRRLSLCVLAYLGSMRKAAKALGISQASICRWSKDYGYETTPSSKRPKRSSKVTDAMVAIIQLTLQEHPATPAWQLQLKVQNVLGISVSRQLISLILATRLNYSWKRIRKRGPRGSGWTDDRIQDFKDRFLEAYRSGTLSSWDESSFDQRSHAIYGYARKGVRAILKVPACRCSRKHHSLLMGIHMDGSRHSIILQGSVKSDHFAQFIETAPFPPGTVILLDNHSMHKTQLVKLAASKKQYQLLFVPAYSPEFNPIEMTFGITKSAFYKLRYTDAFGSDMEGCIDTCLDSLSPQTVSRCFRHVSKLIDGTGPE